MTTFRPLVLLITLFVFSVTTFADTVVMVKMSSDMAVAALESMDMADCDDCQSDDGTCDFCTSGCIAHAPIPITTIPSQIFRAPDLAFNILIHQYISHIDPPEPSPPKILI